MRPIIAGMGQLELLRRTLALLLLLVVCQVSLAADAKPALSRSLESALSACFVPRDLARFVPATTAEYSDFKTAFRNLLSEATQGIAPSSATRQGFQALRFNIGPVTVGTETVLLVSEMSDSRRGGGAYAVRQGRDAGAWTAPTLANGKYSPLHLGSQVSRLAVTIPHCRSDTYTEIEGARLFAFSRARVLLQSTVHRDILDSSGQEADMSHRTDTFFQAAAEAVDSLWVGALVVQLHGFAKTNYPTLASAIYAIISDGMGGSTAPYGAVLAYLLSRHPKPYLAVYGTDVALLGGTTNVQGILFNGQGRNTFVHQEQTSETRQAAIASKIPGQGASLLDSYVLLAGVP
ncbi:MAG: hypothetical protein HY815_34175 [Candidatus Riflebacteria bacterium]|nr:hypothetical protein [Candidatus Riflebacteria bacterium]